MLNVGEYLTFALKTRVWLDIYKCKYALHLLCLNYLQGKHVGNVLSAPVTIQWSPQYAIDICNCQSARRVRSLSIIMLSRRNSAHFSLCSPGVIYSRALDPGNIWTFSAMAQEKHFIMYPFVRQNLHIQIIISSSGSLIRSLSCMSATNWEVLDRTGFESCLGRIQRQCRRCIWPCLVSDHA